MNLVPRHSLFDVDNLFDHFWAPSRRATDDKQVTAFAPRVDIKEKSKSYEITAELPGVDKDDVHVQLEKGMLSIQAESSQEDVEEKDGKVIRQERRYGKFYRSFDLGADVKEDDIKASFKNGVLHLDIPRTNGKVETSRRIPIK